ncbi:unnamed protein product [Rhodiola kirilowii]
MPASQGRFVKLIGSVVFKPNEVSSLINVSLLIARRLSSVDESFNGGGRGRNERRTERGGQNPPSQIPNRQLRGERRNEFQSEPAARGGRGGGNRSFDRERIRGRSQSGGFGEGGDERGAKRYPSSSLENLKKPLVGDDEEKRAGERFLDKFKLGGDRKEKPAASPILEIPETDGNGTKLSETKPEEADEIFKKMKENGLIPNAVAMLDGLCKDGLVQEAMKLFKLMREKGQIPEVVIYTAVVEGFCKAHKCDDAKRIFRKMQTNGIVPNAYSYTVLIQGLLRCSHVDDAAEYSLEMLEAGHSPNLVTFVGLVDGVATGKSVEEAQKVINSLREKGYFVDEKAVRTYLDKKAPALPLVWEAVLGKKSPQSLF